MPVARSNSESVLPNADLAAHVETKSAHRIPSNDPPAGSVALEPARAKLFQNGRSQAVRLPKAFRFEGKEVHIRRQGLSVLLTPVMDAETREKYWNQVFEDIDSLGPLDIPYCEDTSFVEPENIFPEGW